MSKATQRYTATPHPIETLLTWVKSGEIAIPEIQRPFVWDATKVRNLLDSSLPSLPRAIQCDVPRGPVPQAAAGLLFGVLGESA
jgi:hypothetical protein